MSSQEEFATFELIFHGREPELDDFSKEFNHLQWVSKHIRRLGPKGAMYWGGAPAELLILVVSLAANILTIVDILTKRVARGHDSIIRVGKKEIQLKGVWRSKEIADILNIISRKTSKEEALKQIAEIKSGKITEAREQLTTIEGTIQEYERLVETFDDIPKKKRWQKKRAEEYKKTLTKLQKEAEYLEAFIDFLKQQD